MCTLNHVLKQGLNVVPRLRADFPALNVKSLLELLNRPFGRDLSASL